MYPPEETPDTVKVEESASKPRSGSALAAAVQSMAAKSVSSATQDLLDTVEARGAGDAGARVHGRAAQPQAPDRRAIARQLGQRAHPQRLVERQLGVMRLALRPALG